MIASFMMQLVNLSLHNSHRTWIRVCVCVCVNEQVGHGPFIGSSVVQVEGVLGGTGMRRRRKGVVDQKKKTFI